jgi:hypothetical protein
MKTPQQIEAAARAQGVNTEAIYKWRQRGVPALWQVKLMGGRRFTLGDFKAYADHYGIKENGK